MGRIGAINAQVSATKTHHNFLPRTHPIHPICPQTYVLGPFGPFFDCTNFGAEPVPLMQKFVQQSRVGIFRNERTRCTPLDPKLMFWGFSDHFNTP
jgi:hypothetical protein